ncbi:MAG: trypsin-like peptidase domain-containing protein [Bacteroidota bacterium]
MKKFNWIIILLVFALTSVHAQQEEKVYFDVSGKKALETGAYYYRVLVSVPNVYKSYYMSGKLYFEGNISTADSENEANNKYSGTCTWYYKSEKKKVEKKYNTSGQEDGSTFYYYESGKLWKEIEYKNGSIVNGKYREYSEKGTVASIFEESFDTNINDWDMYVSNASSAKLSNGQFELKSLTKEGTSRLISIPIISDDYIIETTIDNLESNGNKVGLVWGFKDWQNYNYLAISESYFDAGIVYEGVQFAKVDGMYSAELVKRGKNTIKLFVNNEKLIITFNGVLQTKIPELKMQGNQLGYVVSGISTIKVDNLIIKELNGTAIGGTSNTDMSVKSTGSGLILSQNGYIATNYHVIENNNKIIVDVVINGETKSYDATVIQKDEQNDLAILKIKDTLFNIGEIKYAFSETGTFNVGAGVFTIGFPYALSGMGKDAKYTDGKVSAKTGYNGAINSFQTSIPVQPGNSGGPIFNDKGQLVGVLNAKFSSADNVSYAIKLNNLKSLFDLLPETPMPSNNKLETLSMEEKIKVLSTFVVLIKVK